MTVVVPPASADVAAADEAFRPKAVARVDLVDVAMRIDAARQHQQPACVDRLACLKVRADRRDAAVRDADVGPDHVGLGDDRAAAHDAIEGLRHGAVLPVSR